MIPSSRCPITLPHLFAAACLLVLSVCRVSAVWAQATLENPAPDSAQSGLGVISGWACQAGRIEIEFNDDVGTRQPASYGTARADTAGTCGDTNNGFGLLYNWNLLGDGRHTVRALADGQEFAQVTVTVTTLGQEYAQGLSREVPVANFPGSGEQRTLVWQESQQNFVITAGQPTQGGGTRGTATQQLENPQPGSYQSGLGLISGWVCEAGRIEIEFNGDPSTRQPAGYGTARADTAGACGDTNNGFGLLFNWNLLGDGLHTVRALADGVAFAQVSVQVTTLGEEYAERLSREVVVADFPAVGTDTTLMWQERRQNFVMTAVLPTQRLVPVSPAVSLPAGVTSVSASDVRVTSLVSSTSEVQASPASTLLLAEDAGETVLLSLADMDGGLLGESPGQVEVSIGSTAVVLVAVASGRPPWKIDQELVAAIQSHDEFGRLTRLLAGLLAADKNYLDRLYDYPNAVTLIKSVAADVASVGTDATVSGVRVTLPQIGRTAPPPLIVTPASSAVSSAVANQEQGPITANYKEDFYCVPGSGFSFGLIPCSPWDKYEPWHWFGDAQGVKEYFPDSFLDVVLNLVVPGFTLAQDHAELVWQASGDLPFLAVSHGAVQGCSERNCGNDVHAIANPNFVNYATELYEGDMYRDWFYTPRNATGITKLLNSGAAYRRLRAGTARALSPEIDRIRFQRYRFSLAEGNEADRLNRGVAVGFMNLLHIVLASVNIVSDVSEIRKALKVDAKNHVQSIAACSTGVVTALAGTLPERWTDIRDAEPDEIREQLAEIFVDLASGLLGALDEAECGEMMTEMLGEHLWTAILKGSWQYAKTAADTASLATPLGWVKLAFDAANEAVPVGLSYFRPAADHVDYYLDWENNSQGTPYISTVSRSRLPDDDDDVPPAAPTNLRATADASSVTLEWDAVAGTGIRYVLYQHYSGGRHWAREVAGPRTTFSGLEADTEYCWDVVAVNAARQESAPSARQCAQTELDDIAQTVEINSAAATCGQEAPWRACYHQESVTAGQSVTFAVTMPQERSGVWHGAWCVKTTQQGLCAGQHDRRSQIDKRFAREAPLTFETTPRGTRTFWVVAEVRECTARRCTWPNDFTEVEFHHIEVTVQGRTIVTNGERGLVAHYPFDGNAQDASGHGRHGSVRGAVPTMDRHGNAAGAYAFDGRDDVIVIPNGPVFNDQPAFTLSLWAAFNDPYSESFGGNGVTCLLAKGTNYDYQYGLCAVNNRPGRDLFTTAWQSEGGGVTDAAGELTLVRDGAWHSIVGVVSAEVSKLYVDGKLIATSEASTGRRWNTSGNADVTIGGILQQGGTGFFSGKIDDVRIYNRALSDAEVAALRTTGEVVQMGDTFTDTLRSGGEGPEMVVIPGGSFRMGCLSNDGDCVSDEFPVHQVTVPSFAMGKYEVTFAEWDACVTAGGCNGYRPDDKDLGRGTRPVINVDWHDAQSYVAWLSAQTGEEYRLPSEAEWEYAARAGTETKYHWGDEIGVNLANCTNNRNTSCGDSFRYTATVGSFRANAWGLYDMHGNVSEWAQDCYHRSYEGAPSDGSARESARCGSGVRRGGSWDEGLERLRSAQRLWSITESVRGGSSRGDRAGFRIARSLP